MIPETGRRMNTQKLLCEACLIFVKGQYEKGKMISHSFSFFLFINLFIYFWLHWVFKAERSLCLQLLPSLLCAGFSLQWLILLRSTGFRHAGSVVVARGLQSAGSVVVAHGLSRSVACGIFLHQRSNPCSLHWQADS